MKNKIKVIKRFFGGSTSELIKEKDDWIRKNKDIIKDLNIDHRINSTGTVMFTNLSMEIYQILQDEKQILPYIK